MGRRTDHLHKANCPSNWDRLVPARVSASHNAAAALPCRCIAVGSGPRASQLPPNAASLATHAGPAR